MGSADAGSAAAGSEVDAPLEGSAAAGSEAGSAAAGSEVDAPLEG
jgi:hypothetical protein